MSKITTISVKENVKMKLDKMRKGKDWSSFLLEIAEKAEKYDKAKAIKELRTILSDEELDKIAEECKHFRKGFKLREGS